MGVYRGEEKAQIVQTLLSLADDSEKGEAARGAMAQELNSASGYNGPEETLREFREAMLLESLRWIGELGIAEAEPLLGRYRSLEPPPDADRAERRRLLQIKYLAEETYADSGESDRVIRRKRITESEGT